MRSLILVLILGSGLLAEAAHAQTVGGSCTTGMTASPDTDGHNLQCVGGVWAIASPDIPTGLIAAFASTTCPTGWTEFTAARGVFLRGYDPTNTFDPNGSTRTVGTTIQSATTINESVGYAHDISVGNSDGSTSLSQGYYQISNGSSGSQPVYKLRPVNVAVLFCKKN